MPNQAKMADPEQQVLLFSISDFVLLVLAALAAFHALMHHLRRLVGPAAAAGNRPKQR